MPKPEITTRFFIHLNGGSKHSCRVDTVLVDGKECGVTLGYTTDGSPTFNVLSRELCFRLPEGRDKDEEVLDLLDESLTQKDIDAWILARALTGPREVADAEAP